MSDIRPATGDINDRPAKKRRENKQRTDEERSDVSRRYKKKSLLEHIKTRPDTYIGSCEPVTELMWVLDPRTSRMVQREVTYTPGLFKIFDEILVNAADNKARDATMKFIKVTIDKSTGEISVTNDGMGIPVENHEEHKMYIPEMVFGHLLTGDNYDDSSERVVGGRNGYGAKLTNIFSTRFAIETCDARVGRKYSQTWTDNMANAETPRITKGGKKSYTRVTFTPDYQRFGMQGISDDTYSLLAKRVVDVAGTSPRDVRVYLNGERIPVADFKSYASLYFSRADDASATEDASAAEAKSSAGLVYERINDRWEICVAMSSDQQAQQVSFCNSICTIKGGEHVKCIANQVAASLLRLCKKKFKGVDVKASQVKHSLWVFVNALIVNPSFDSQTKETLTTRASKFGPDAYKPVVSDKFMKRVLKCGVVDEVLHFARSKQLRSMQRKMGGAKKSKLLGIPKLDDANLAGGRKSQECTLILTEGDSAKALAVAGLSVVGRNKYGVFPLKGKLLNVRDASNAAVLKNSEIQNIMKIMGLNIGTEYADTSKLRYGHILIMTDQDHDGSHIKGLLINFVHHFWPSLLRIPNFLQVFITPIVKATRHGQTLTFYTTPEYDAWREANRDGEGWSIKYFKGLGTSSAREAKEYFSNLAKHRIPFSVADTTTASRIDMAFRKNRVEDRKDWIGAYETGTHIDFDVPEISYTDFVDKELIIMAIHDNMRSLPCVVDGLKPSQRKVLFAAFKRKLHKEIKVAQLAGYTSEHAAYHHGEQSLNETIIKMAQTFVGSNNINLLMPNGQFGTRLMGGKDAASPRYVFTQLSSLAELIYHPDDAPLLEYINEEGLSIEPRWFIPVIPMLLVNGSTGIGTGWSTSIPNFNPLDIIAAMKDMIARAQSSDAIVDLTSETSQPDAASQPDAHANLVPYYEGYKGTITPLEGGRFEVRGRYELVGGNRVRIVEIPVGQWINNYKAFLEDPKHFKEGQILDVRCNHTDTTVDFTVTLSPEFMAKMSTDAALCKKFKLVSTISTTNMHCFDAAGKIRKYDNVQQIMAEFYDLRFSYYTKRKAYCLARLRREFRRISNKVRFVLAVVSGDFVISNRPKSELLEQLRADGYQNSSTEDNSESSMSSSHVFDYLLSMPLWNLTMEKVNQLRAERDRKEMELMQLEGTSVFELWLNDLDNLEHAIVELRESLGRSN